MENNAKDPLLYEISIPYGNLTLLFYFNERIYTDNSAPSKPHDHPDYEIHYMVHGMCRHFIDRHDHNAYTGDVVILHPNQYHYQEQCLLAQNISRFFSLRLAVKPPIETASSTTMKAYTALRNLLDSHEVLRDDKMTMMPFLRQIQDEINTRQNGYYLNLQAACTCMMTALIRLGSEEDQKNIYPNEKLKHISHWRHQIENFLFNHYAEDLHLQDLAEAIGLSQRQTSRLISREYGINFVAKLNDVRIQRAAYMLRTGTQNIHEVSVACGFSNYGYFSTCFHKKTGHTPSEYHKQFLKK